jgi:ribosomal protein S18 acetylase RimI-like enzyme
VIEEIYRKYLEIKSIKKLIESPKPEGNYYIKINNKRDFQLNRFFYKQIGQKYQWTDRLNWKDQDWINYISNRKLSTFILKCDEEIIGYFELIFHENQKEMEIAYFGILEEYFGKKLGGFLLSEAIKKSFADGAKRVWLHTCSLDHKYALKNYLARGMTIFQSEKLIRKNN